MADIWFIYSFYTKKRAPWEKQSGRAFLGGILMDKSFSISTIILYLVRLFNLCIQRGYLSYVNQFDKWCQFERVGENIAVTVSEICGTVSSAMKMIHL